jgi:hypothetical protein
MTSYELRDDETPIEALRRIVAEQMLGTAAGLRDPAIDTARRVHDSRKRFKEIRALLRLFRDPLAEQFALENHWYRDAARELADYRDADAVVAAVNNLSPKVKQHLGPDTMRRLRNVSRSEHRAIYRDRETAAAKIENVAAQLPVAAERLNNLSQESFEGFASIMPGMMRTIRQGRRAMHEAYESRNAIAFHEWRKRVKDHWYQVQLLTPLSSKLAKREKMLDKLSHILGEHHDLEVIRGVVIAAETAFAPDEAARIDEALAQRQERLARKAQSIGRKIYGQRAIDFATRLQKRWEKRHVC